MPAESSGQQHRYHHFPLVVEHHRFQRQLLGQRFTRLHLDEDRRFLQPAAQVHRHRAEHAAQQERNAPTAAGNALRAERSVDHRRHHRAQQDAHRQPGGQRATGEADAPARHVFGNEDPCARHLTADRRPCSTRINSSSSGAAMPMLA